jgi:phosphoglycerate dehydrogenase-like enzyme
LKLVIVEPLGVAKEKLLKMAADRLKDKMEIIYYDTRTTDTAELIARGRDADVVAVSNLPISSAVINGWQKLKMLAVAFTGVDHIALEACRARGVVVTNCAGYSTAAVADLVFGLLIALNRNIIACDQAVRGGGTKEGLIGCELEGKKFGVVGTGAIGLRVAAIAQAFGCEVFASSRTKKDLPGITHLDLDHLLETCDIISLHVPLNETTRGLINREKLALMKPTGILINTARGPVVDSQALADALKEGHIAGAAVDVFEEEPPIELDHPLFHVPNIIVTPHIAYATPEAFEKRAVMVFDNIGSWLEGTPQNLV